MQMCLGENINAEVLMDNILMKFNLKMGGANHDLMAAAGFCLANGLEGKNIMLAEMCIALIRQLF